MVVLTPEKDDNKPFDQSVSGKKSPTFLCLFSCEERHQARRPSAVQRLCRAQEPDFGSVAMPSSR